MNFIINWISTQYTSCLTFLRSFVITNIETTIKVNFKDIPVECKFAVFNKGHKDTATTWVIQPGDTTLEIKVPNNWQEPFRNLRCMKYFTPNSYEPIDLTTSELNISGSDFYIDIDRDVMNEEHNQKSIETLIHGIYGAEALDGRQKFFISLISLQSYFEHLVYGMLVMSGHISNRRFQDLFTHANRTPVAFSNANTDFFTNQISICPGKDNLGDLIDGQLKNELEAIFNETRTLRNKVVHKWGYKDIGQQALKDIFLNIGESIMLNDSEDAFYKDATFVCIRLYAKTSYLKNQLSYFNEKLMVSSERQSRGFQ